MLSKVRKIKLYYQALYKGELLKRIEYKIKDLTGYFYIRNKFEKYRRVYCSIHDVNLNIPKLEEGCIEEEKYRIFNDKVYYQDFIKKLKVEEVFWRKIKLNDYEDIKINWEYNRLQILLPLAIKYLNLQNEEYKKNIQEILNYWEKNNKFEYTLNWNSNLEVAIRAINIAMCLLLLQDKENNKKYSRLLYMHAKHIYNEINYSCCCIPNNHLIGEAVALLLLSRVINNKESKKWYQKAIKILKQNIDIIDDNGISKENSFSYQFFVTKMYILALCFIKEKDLFEKVNEKIIKSLSVLKFTIINKKEILNYGDNDSGFLYSIYMDYNIAKDIENYYNLFFENKDSGETKIYNEIFKNFNNLNTIKNGKIEKKTYIATKNIFIYKENNIILFFNSKKIEGHAHNDSLSINLIINGQEVFMDSGTYSYNKSKQKRDYYRSRKSHSTIQIEQDENCKKIGTFRWIDRNIANLKILEENENLLKIKGKIEKFCERTITIYKKENKIKIQDVNLKNRTVKSNWVTQEGILTAKNIIDINSIKIIYENDVNIKEHHVNISKEYLHEQKAKLYVTESEENEIRLKIEW